MSTDEMALSAPSSVTQRAIEDARRVVELLGGILGQMSPEAIEYALQLNEVLTPLLDRHVQEHGDAAALQVARDLVAWGQSLSDKGVDVRIKQHVEQSHR